jgi:crossover junction endodeoxyribonuclease RuvC
MITISIGIDNGLSGALVAVSDRGQVEWWDTPVIDPGKGKGKRSYAVAEMKRLLEMNLYHDEKATVFLEKAQPMPKQGVSSMFTIGLGYGLWQGICAGLGLPYELVHPRTWQKVMLRDVPGKDTKARSMIKCQQLFPDIPLMKPRGRVLSMDGRADAALIAAYGMRVMRGEQQ